LIIDRWLPFEIHPDTPLEGVRWADYFPGMNSLAFFQQLDARGKSMGVRFGPQPLMSNSRQALEAGEFAKAHGLYDDYHEAVFRTFFSDLKDIGNREVILQLAAEVGLDAKNLQAALEAGTYDHRLEETTRMAHEQGIRSAPTYVVEGYGFITGAQPIDNFRTVLHTVAGQSKRKPPEKSMKL
jgi:predicted DsbA family dithiol-disulfide isomerase